MPITAVGPERASLDQAGFLDAEGSRRSAFCLLGLVHVTPCLTIGAMKSASAVAATLLVLWVGGLQVHQRAYDTNLATHPDEAAHFVTAACLLDYLRTSAGTNPVSFAESYYVHYPKVAFGHWPPAFHGIQALWYAMVGPSPATAMLLVGLITVLAALLLFQAVRRVLGTWIAGLTCAVFLFLPLVQRSASLLMADMLASVFSFLAVLAFCDSLTAGATRASRAALWWTALAILTKESALLLLVFAPAALLLLGGDLRGVLRRTRSLWLGLGVVVTALLVAYQATGVFHLRELPHFVSSPAADRLGFLLGFLKEAPVAVFAMAAIGALSAVIKRRGTTNDRGIYLQGSAIWLAIVLASQALFRDVLEPRYYLPAVFPLMLLFAFGLDQLKGRMIPLIVSLFCLASMPLDPLRTRSGYAELAASIPNEGAGSVVLVSSDSSGEGALIVERLIRDDTRQGLVLRASKLLARADWMGGNYQPLVHTVGDVRDLLDAIPVHYIVIDMNGFISEEERSHHRLLEQTMREGSEQFRLIGDRPLVFDRQRREAAVQVFENLHARGRRAEVIRVDMNDTLGRVLELRVGDRPVHASSRGDGEPTPGARIQRAATWVRQWFSEPPPPSSPRIQPRSDALSEWGGPGQIFVSAGAQQRWEARASASWIAMTSSTSGSGNGVVRYEVATNDTGEPRAGDIVVGELRYPIRQDARAR